MLTALSDRVRRVGSIRTQEARVAKFKTGDRVQYHGTQVTKTTRYEGKTGTVTNGDACNVRWDDGEEAEFLIAGNLRLLSVSPIRIETVTTRRIEPGVYGRLELSECVSSDPRVPVVGLEFVARDGERHPKAALNALELRELARVALELAEYLENV